MYRSDEHPYMIANIDGRIWIGDEPGILEIKTADRSQARYWREGEVPDNYYAQVQHYMAVLGYGWAYVVCLLGRGLIWRKVPRNEEFIARLVAEEGTFRDRYMIGTEIPEPSGMERDAAILLALYGESRDEVVNAEAIRDYLRDYHELGIEMRNLKARHDAAGNAIKAALGSARIGIADGYRATWSRFDTARIDVDKLRKEMPVVAAQYTKTSPSGMLRVICKGEKE